MSALTIAQLAPPQRAACLDDLEALALVDGTLQLERLDAAVEHVERCAECRELIEGLCAVAVGPDTSGGAVPNDPRIGAVVDGRFRIDAVLADGAMGRVYRATELALGREVAIKVPRSSAYWLVRRFDREVALTARLAHPGIIALHTAGVLGDGLPYYAMPLVDGISLEVALIRATNRAERLALLDHVLAAAIAVASAHARGIVHRDLKPHNVIVGRFAETVILDWGLAKDLATVEPARAAPRSLIPPALAPHPASTSPSRMPAGRTTRPGDVLGTPAFMAPEQARGEPVDRRCDVYSLGAMLEILLVGRVPGRAVAAALALAPPELAAICRRAMSPEPEHRHADAAELAAELRAAIEQRHRPAIVPPVAAPRMWRWLAVASAAGVAGVVASIALGWL